MRLAVIPARGGSKRIPGKNIRSFSGSPIITFPVKAALASGCFDRIIVSTDSPEIAHVARLAGAETPFKRPAELSDDQAATAPVIRHAIDVLGLDAADAVCCIYATAAFVRGEDLAAGLAALLASQADFAFAVGRYASPIQRALRVAESGRLCMIDPARYATRTQDLEPAFHDAGQFYWGTAQAWKTDGNPYDARVAPVVLDAHRLHDIDTPEDWRRAELMFRILQAEEGRP